MNEQSSRLIVVDALRGFAIVSIMLLHNIEHFDYYYTVPDLPQWMQALDAHIWATLFFLFGGKSFAVFALLFGLTFFIQQSNAAKNNRAFVVPFVKRMFLLLGFGLINSIFFQGDILSIYAVLGLLLLPVRDFSNRVLLLIAFILLMQPLHWLWIFDALNHPADVVQNPTSWTYFGKMAEYIPRDSFIDTAIGNLTNGKRAVLLWNLENGRYFKIFALFILGLILGRKGLFTANHTVRVFWMKIGALALVSFAIFYWLVTSIDHWIENELALRHAKVLAESWRNTSFMFLLVSVFYLLFHSKIFQRLPNIFSPFGKMSLSNYVMQSVLGSSIYYGFGLGLYQYTSSTYAFIIGIILSVVTGIFCVLWLKRYKRGPLESIWHYLTWK